MMINEHYCRMSQKPSVASKEGRLPRQIDQDQDDDLEEEDLVGESSRS